MADDVSEGRQRHAQSASYRAVRLSSTRGGIRPMPFIRVKRFKIEKKIKAPFTLSWVNSFCEHANPYLGALALFMFSTGRGRGAGREPEHVDLQQRTILIPKSKISEQRIVHLLPRVLAAIANLEGAEPLHLLVSHARLNAWPVAEDDQARRHQDPDGPQRPAWLRSTTLRKGLTRTAACLAGGKASACSWKTYAHAIDDITLNEAVFDAPTTQPAPKTSKSL
ncbi:hypothetical protein IVB34_12870 [Bradyrhizobium sp. 2]|uniref:hypothetical protein n=1 Tax=Bradyrhizobium sp. 2 TaxID=190045 RepID=UPI001FFA621E|nr:hypothetical protein [Bradyrhizobium sp. 2]MCK1459248.1 hypothetical protein [Bradyrhizobium sp. 2]